MSFSGDPEASSSSRPTYPNRVFLSFRGEDTRLTFTGHLYTALMNAGLQTFKDDIEINRGETIKSELERGIQQSSVSLIVFSKDYASSCWCLNELVMILEHSKASQHVVIPLFYDIEPANVRHQTGSIGEAFDKYERKVEAENNTERRNRLVEDIGRWRAALKEVADISGFELKKEANGNEAIFVQQVVAKVQIIMKPRLLNVDSDKLVGMGRLEDIDLWIKDANPNATIMLICGMGGIGKTTIARKVYNDNHIYFGGCSFLSRVSERSKQYNDLVNLQKQLLSDINRTTEDIHSKDEGFNKIRDVLRFKKVLLVLDDVDDVDQLEDIFKMQGLSPGSKIIVTTRNVNLKHYNEHCKVHKVATLRYSESVELFSLHAFRQNHPTESYMEHVKKIVSHCEGLPLALKVLGGSLYKKEIDIWEDLIKNLDANPNIKIVQKLEISFNCLQEDDVKNVFLYIACFFDGEDKNRTIEILNACDQMMRAVYGIDHLVDVCLLEIGFHNTLRMHQLIKDMGRYIVHKESLDEPGERSRLWHSQDCFNVLRDKTGTRKVKALAFDMQICREHESIISRKRKRHARNSNENILETDAFAKMQSLLYIKLSNVELSGCYADFPKKLGWLCWHRCHLACMPSDLYLRKLVCLEMRCSSLKQLWEGPKDLPALKILDLSHSLSLATCPDFSEMPNLERLILEGCTQLLEVCESIEYADGLVLLNLRDCKRLSKLPRNISMLQSLKELDISGCSSLSEFNASRVDMSALVSPAQGISCVASFPQFIEVLSLESCKLSNDCFPNELSNLSLLKRLNLSGNLITSLPECCGRLGNLEYLNVSGCSLLESVVGLPNILKSRLTEGNSESDKKFMGTMYSSSYMSWKDCPRLAEIEGYYKRVSIRDVERGIIKKLGLMDLDPSLLESDLFDNVEVEERWGTLSTFLPLDKLPGCFRSLELINNVNPRLPLTRGELQVPDKRNNIQGLTLGFVYHDTIFYKFYMKLVFNIFEQDKESNKELEYNIWKKSDVITRDRYVVWLLHINFRKPLLQPGDVIHFLIIGCISEFHDIPQAGGIYKVVYDEEEEDDQEFDLSFPYSRYFRKAFSFDDDVLFTVVQ